ncbi:hypothetical protein V6N11_060110 [Hibiscus sabdariffa]|uniref:Uncharacterized protein n=2 Tax=Hibiscus sabdariffa TaxID=183260 RepID=A0ABR1ZAK3_9ROSI
MESIPVVDSEVVLASEASDNIVVVDTGFNDTVVVVEVAGDVACLDMMNDSDDLQNSTGDGSTVVAIVAEFSFPNNVEGQELSPHKSRIAAGSVADLLNQLKPKVKGKGQGQHKKKGGKADDPSNPVT